MALVTRYKVKKPGKFLIIALILLLAIGLAGINVYRWFFQPNIQLENKQVDYLYIPSGAVFDDVVQLLTYQGWLQNETSFKAVARLIDYDKLVKAGRYKITEGMKIAASKGIASLIDEKDLKENYIIVSPFNEKVVPTVAKAVEEAAVAEGVIRK